MSEMIGVCGFYASSVYSCDTKCKNCNDFKTLEEINQGKDITENELMDNNDK